MSFNKAREERKWRIWKDAEERQMRQLAVDEETIEQLRKHDWTVFNSDRKFYRRLHDTNTYFDGLNESVALPEVQTVEDFLNAIENETLYHILIAVDKLTLQIVLMKIQGFSTTQIADRLSLTPKAIYRRMDRLKEKLKKIFE